MTDPIEPSTRPTGTSSTEPDPPDSGQGGSPATGPVPAASRLKPPALWRVGVVGLCAVALLVSAALAMGASPAPSSDATNPGRTDAHGQSDDAWSLGGPGVLAPDVFGRGKGLGRGHRGRPFGQITITAIDGSSLSLRTDNGWTRTITIGSSTTITKAGKAISASELKVGDAIRFRETRQDDGTYTIDRIVVVVPTVAGTVGDVTDNGFTLKTRDGTTWTITVDGSTSYRLGIAEGSRGDVKSGVDVVVAGTQGATDNSLTASTVVVRLPVVAGEVTATSGSSITIRRRNATTLTIHVSDSTTYRVAGVENARLSDVKVGMRLVAQGRQRSDGSIDAVAVAAGNGRGLLRGLRGLPGLPGLGHGNGRGDGSEPDGSPAPSTGATQG